MPDYNIMHLRHVALKEASRGQSMKIESMQKLTETNSLAVTQASTSDADSRAVFAGANISSIFGCQFQTLKSPVKII